ncbi:hypothetical protein ACFSSG_15250 [Euzebyella marina]|uniref:HEAT repeat domain-containing protein n=1 Tax=Euzebyella marina TaxID=1761453 RepID=UPI0013CF313E|nr:HEAT repeat domain-containing protein [Euzebyella marina]
MWILTLVFVGLALLYFISVFIFRNKISSTSSRTKKQKKELSPMVSEFLFYEEDADKAEKSHYLDLKIQIRELLKNDFNRKVLTEVLLDLRKDVSGDTKKRLFKLYQDLGLDQDAYEKLKSWRWEVISKGISHLTQMQVESAYTFITKFINDRRSTVRKQAEIAAVTLKPEGINYFLDTTRYKISEWQQLKLLDVLRNREDFEPPRFKYWLTSTNRYVVFFALRLIKFYNQNDANAALIELVKHKNNQIKMEAIGCIKEFFVLDAKPMLKQVFPKCSVDVKIAILGALGELGDESDIAFLNKTAQSEGNFAVKSKALSAINMIAPDTVMPTEGLDNRGIDITQDAKENVNGEDNIQPTITEDENHSETILEEAAEKIQPNSTVEAPVIPHSETVPVDVILSESEESTDQETVEVKSSEAMEENEEVPNFSTNEEDVNEPTEIQIENLEVDFELIVSETEESMVPEAEVETGNLTPIEEVNDIEITEEEITHQPLLDINFLPIVISEQPPVQNNEKQMTDKNDSEYPHKKIRQIEVNFEQLNGAEEITEKVNEETFDIEEISFLPIVVENDKTNKDSVHLKDESLLEEVHNLDFLPIVTESEAQTKPEEESAVEELDGFKLSDFEIDFEPQDIKEETKEFDFELSGESLINVDSNTSNADDVISWLMSQNEIDDIEVEYEEIVENEDSQITNAIPEPIYYDEHEAYMMGLLDDLEELGDHREIALLEELLEDEKQEFIKERIVRMIAVFSKEKDGHISMPKLQLENLNLPNFSVFADLFKNIDREAKLILLDEIVAVGDEKEIEFLDTLLEDPDRRLRKKARKALKLLISKVSEKENQEESKKKDEDEQLTKELFDNQMAKENPGVTYTESEYNEVLEEIEADVEVETIVDPELFDIDFELSEVLQKTHTQQVLELPVVATEITPNGASLMFKFMNYLNLL